jgi:hypothetical protein
MDESMDAVEPKSGGLSRRDMIKASVIAGGLVWSAPVLLTGKAAALVNPSACCPTGFSSNVGFKITNYNAGQDMATVNCGADCLTSVVPNLGCSTQLPDCLVDQGFVDVVAFEKGSLNPNPVPGFATIDISEDARILAVAVNTEHWCIIAECPTFAPNTCSTSNAANPCPTSPSVATTPRITVTPNGTGQRINIQMQLGDETINQLHIALCINSDITGVCP